MKIVLVDMETKKLRDHMGYCPLRSENFCQVFNIVNSCFSNRVNAVTQPGYANGIQFLNEEDFTKLLR